MTAPIWVYPVAFLIAAPVFFLIAVFLFLLLRAFWIALVAPVEEMKGGRSRSEFMKWGFPAKRS